MSYQVLARKWRPAVFKDLVGQSSIVRILSNSLKENRLHHALLLAGPRGTGKTSTARILAKSLNCPEVKNLNPCGQCKTCQEIDQGRSLDVMEIDGASNNGVEAVRQLKETISYLPASAYKIYIIDEVHILSISAFNALLKTLEEPPPHTLFIMATTEMRKIPATVLSRCQVLPFHQIPDRLIYERLKAICQKEEVKTQDSALWMLARGAEGSLRDAQGLLDQMISFCHKNFGASDVNTTLGLTERSLLTQSLTALLEKSPQKILIVLNQLKTKGEDPALFLQHLIKELRNLLLLKLASSEALQNLLCLSDQEKEELLKKAKAVSPEDLHLLMDMALKGSSEITRVQDPQVFLEVLLLKMSQAPYLESLFGAGPLEDPLKDSVEQKPINNTAQPKEQAITNDTAQPKEQAPKPAQKALTDFAKQSSLLKPADLGQQQETTQETANWIKKPAPKAHLSTETQTEKQKEREQIQQNSMIQEIQSMFSAEILGPRDL